MQGELLVRRSSTSQDTPSSSVPCCIRSESSDEEPDERENKADSQSTNASGVHKCALLFSLFQGQWQLLLRHTSWFPSCLSLANSVNALWTPSGHTTWVIGCTSWKLSVPSSCRMTSWTVSCKRRGKSSGETKTALSNSATGSNFACMHLPR